METKSYIGYRLLCGVLALFCFVFGIAQLVSFFRNIMLPASMLQDPPLIPTDYWGFYMIGFAGALLCTWGAILLSAIRSPASARGIGTATAFGLVLNAMLRIIAWFSGEFAEIGNIPRVEAAIMLLLAIGFIWMRPEPPDRTQPEAAHAS
jgi:hypothetical protein